MERKLTIPYNVKEVYEVEIKTKPEYVWSYIPPIELNATDKCDAERKALDYAVAKLNKRREAIEVGVILKKVLVL